MVNHPNSESFSTRITAVLFMKLFWIVETVFFFVPGILLIKIWLGIWIMFPNFYVSDPLDKFQIG